VGVRGIYARKASSSMRAWRRARMALCLTVSNVVTKLNMGLSLKRSSARVPSAMSNARKLLPKKKGCSNLVERMVWRGIFIGIGVGVGVGVGTGRGSEGVGVGVDVGTKMSWGGAGYFVRC